MDPHTTGDDSMGPEPANKPDRSYPSAFESDHHDQPRSDIRTCWICREDVEPTYPEPSTLDKYRNKRPKRTYYTEDGGHLISPCLCNGSIKYVHEKCLEEWRYARPGSQNLYACSTCKYEYKFERMKWANRIRSPLLSFFLAVLIVIICIFLLGFIADPILDVWLGPVGDFVLQDVDYEDELGLVDLDEDSWNYHFLKGLFSFGLLGFVKTFLAMGPWQWWNLRVNGMGGNRRRGTGRDRMNDMSLYLVAIGAMTFFWTVWKGTRRWTQRTLDKAGERILNVHGDDDDDEDEADVDGGKDNAATASDESKKDQ